jgi:formate dehydrogenase subunit gamma
MTDAVVRARSEEDIPVGDEIVRHNYLSRVIHWTTAVAFFVCLLTGLPIWWPVFGFFAPLFGGLYACRVIHPWSGVVFFAASAVMFLYWVKDMMLDKNDRGWLGPKMIEYLRFQSDDPEVGKYNGGQKLFFFFILLMAFVLFASGLVLWFPRDVSQTWREVAIIAHNASFILSTVAIVAHIYLGTAAEPGTFRSKIVGTVTKDWARLHHPRWFREVTGEKQKRS